MAKETIRIIPYEDAKPPQNAYFSSSTECPPGPSKVSQSAMPTPPVIIVPGIIWETLLQCSIQLRSGSDNPSNVCPAHVLAPLQLLPLVCVFECFYARVKMHNAIFNECPIRDGGPEGGGTN